MFDTDAAKKIIPPAMYESINTLLAADALESTTYRTTRFPLVDLKAQVRLPGTAIRLKTSAAINENTGKLAEKHCNCTIGASGARLCVHEAALIYLYASARKNGSITLDAVEQPSSQAVSDFLMSDDYFSSSVSTDTSASLYLEPHCEINSNYDDSSYLSVEFRIGRLGTKGYVLNSIDNLMDCENNHEMIRYGKKLEFIPSEEAFEASSRPLFRFLKRLYRSEDKYVDSSDYYYWSSYSSRKSLSRYLSLRGSYLDEFMDSVSLTGIYFSFPFINANEVYLRFSEEVPSFPVKLQRQKKGFLFESPVIYFVKGTRYTYFIDSRNPVISRLPSDRSEYLDDFLRFTREAENEPVYINSHDIKTFVKKAYPAIQRICDIETQDVDLLSYLPPKPVFSFYLDLPQKDMITCEAYAAYGNSKYNIFDETKKHANQRNLSDEKLLEQLISPWFNSYDPQNKRMVVIDSDETMIRFVNDGIPFLQSKGEVYISDALKRLQIRTLNKVSLGVSLESNLLQLEISGDQRTLEDLAEILSRYTPKKKYYRLKNGDFIKVEDEESFAELSRFSEDLQLSAQDIRNGSASLPSYRAMYIDKTAEESRTLEIDRDTYFRELIDNIDDSNREYTIPEHLKEILRDYQVDGFNWLCRLHENHFAGLLADEMGLGKTLQVIAFLSSLKERKQCIVVCPASLVFNWRNEFKRFAPDITAVMITGSAAVRTQQIQNAAEDAVLITSYDSLKRDVDLYEGKTFEVEIIDEAQYIKNAATQAAESVKMINANFRIALTGTPIENRLSELWSIYDYLLPGFLYRYSWFRTHFESPIVKDADPWVNERLRKMISPFILRRRKADVLKDLPEKLEEIYYSPLEGEQKELYEARKERLRIMLAKDSDADFNKKRIQVLAELTRLRQTCCAPSLIYENYRGNSSKEDLCIELIKRAIEGGHKVLLFSQFKTMLEILNKRLEKEHINYHFLSGETPKEKRAEMVDSFQEDDVPVFSISLKAGGTGLNLTAADIVIHYDPWWNTAAENQASDRTHRIGQTNIVTVYKLIVEDTIEQKIIDLQKDKSALANEILSGEEMSTSTLSREQLLDIL